MTDKKKSKCPDYFWADLRLKFWYETYLPGQSFGFIPLYLTIKKAKESGVPRKYLAKMRRVDK